MVMEWKPVTSMHYALTTVILNFINCEELKIFIYKFEEQRNLDENIKFSPCTLHSNSDISHTVIPSYICTYL